MSDDNTDKASKAPDAPAPRGVSVVTLIVTAIVTAGSAGGASLFVNKRAAHASAGAHGAAGGHGAATVVVSPHAPPGFTLPLEPFVVMCGDANHVLHAMRATLAIEFAATAREEDVRPFVPRVRDAALAQLRAVTYEAASDPTQTDRLRGELQIRFNDTGVPGLVRVLITDLVVQ